MFHPYQRPQASRPRRNQTNQAAAAAPKKEAAYALDVHYGDHLHFDQWDNVLCPTLIRSLDSSRRTVTRNDDGKSSSLALYDGQPGFTHMRWLSSRPGICPHCAGQHSGYGDSIIIAIDGACPGNGTKRATKSGYGVFFRPWDPSNVAARIPDHVLQDGKHTNNIAEIMAAISALHGATILCEADVQNEPIVGKKQERMSKGESHKLRRIIVKSDSEYVVKSIAGGKNGEPPYIAKWESNGFRTAGGGPVKNAALWRLLKKYVDKLREMGVTVQFWHVRREENKDADRLANEALGLEVSAVTSTVEEEIKRVWELKGV